MLLNNHENEKSVIKKRLCEFLLEKISQIQTEEVSDEEAVNLAAYLHNGNYCFDSSCTAKRVLRDIHQIEGTEEFEYGLE